MAQTLLIKTTRQTQQRHPFENSDEALKILFLGGGGWEGSVNTDFSTYEQPFWPRVLMFYEIPPSPHNAILVENSC